MQDTVENESDDLESPAQTAAILGIIALSLHATVSCTSIMGTMMGTVIGAVALFLGRGVMVQEPTGAARAYANVGFAAGLISVVWGIVIGILIGSIVLIYAVMIGALIAAGA